jgi:hypothetical protein
LIAIWLARALGIGIARFGAGSRRQIVKPAPPELYVPLTGPHEWRFGTGASWTEYKAHTPIWNDPMQVHATLIRDLPFLSLFAWTRDVDAHATVTPSPDWNVIEAGL